VCPSSGSPYRLSTKKPPTPTLDPVVIDRGEQVAQAAEAIRWLRGRVPVVASVNNPFAGYDPETARQLAALAGAAA
jgi:hypothetical protein